MAGYSKPIAHNPSGTVMIQPDDRSLLQAIAERRDETAFSELCRRYEKRAFNTAFRILRDSALAEDAVQEAMLSIWQRAVDAFQPSGEATDWVLRIVVNKSLYLRRNQKHKTMREERMAAERSKPDSAIADAVDSRELVAHLRNQIDGLPELERTLLTCSYCTAMTHREISKLLGISQSSVTEKIQRVLKHLRLDLTKAGVVAALPLLSRETLFEAMTTGTECPAGMTERIVREIGGAGSKAARSLSRRAISARRGSWIPFAAGAVVLSIAACAVAWTMNGQKTKIADVPSTVAHDKSVPPVAVETAPFSRTWNFNTPEQAKDFEVLMGSWHWTANGGADGSGCMETDSDCVVALNCVPPSDGAMLNFAWSGRPPFPDDGISIQVLWQDWKAGTIFAHVGKPQESATPAVIPWIRPRFFLTNRFIAGKVGANNGFSFLFATPRAPGDRLMFVLHGKVQLDDFELRSASAEEVRTEERSVEPYLKALDRIPSERRVGSIELPELPSFYPKKPVLAIFVTRDHEAKVKP
jgi:RNA polymerase sigma-70 factor (ECF subfamily)